MRTIKGPLHLYSETGTEGGYWAIQDENFIFPPTETWPHEHWSYGGLHCLGDGDHRGLGEDEHPMNGVCCE